MTRLAPVDPGALAPEQKRVYDAIASGPRAGVRGPFLALLHVPEMADRIQNVGEYLRYNTSFPPRQSELAILVTARAQRCQYEWFAHSKHAANAGLGAEIIEAIRQERDPVITDPGDRLVYEFAWQLARDKRVADATYAAVTQAFGVRGAVELAGLVGYYAMIAMTLNAHAIRPPADSELPFPD